MPVAVQKVVFVVPGWTGERAVWRGLKGPSRCLGESWEGEVSRLHLGAARGVPGSRGCLGREGGVVGTVVNLRSQDVLEWIWGVPGVVCEDPRVDLGSVRWI